MKERFKKFRYDLKGRLKTAWISFTEWFENNKELAMLILPMIGALLLRVIKELLRIGRQATVNREAEDLKTKYCYDRSEGHYWALKRQLSANEWLQIESRRKNGEKLGTILSSMKVLK